MTRRLNHFSGTLLVSVCIFVESISPFAAPAGSSSYIRKQDWAQTVIASRDALADSSDPEAAATEILNGLENDFPLQWDWLLQDAGTNANAFFDKGSPAPVAMVRKVLQELGTTEAKPLQTELDQLTSASVSSNDQRWLALYERACTARRNLRLRQLPSEARRIVFTKHRNLGGSHYAYTEAQSDAQAERHWAPGASLCMLELENGIYKERTLLKDKGGMIRDPAVSFNGKKILFAWKKSDRQDDFHLYEMDAQTGQIRQLTEGLGFADYEGTYLPNGDILFTSTRCVQTVDCWFTEVSTLYTCDKDGKFMRRVAFDQVHDNFPTVLEDGRVIYTRWEYNDRSQMFVQPLFQMNPDGTGQAEFYGINSWFPTTILHARGIPATGKVLAIATGHHTMQAGKLIVVDPAKGRQEASGVQLIAPPRETKAERIDAYGQDGELFQYPYPFTEENFLVTYHPVGWRENADKFQHPHFKVYFMTVDGRRELLASDPTVSCNQAIPLAPRPVPFQRASSVDYRKSSGTFFMQDIYTGEALPGVARGTIKRLRVVGIDFRAAGIKNNNSNGKGGGALISTPVAAWNGTWDTKIVLGDATVYEDGSAFFQAPARMPLYFQALDDKGHVVQTMRSWSTLQPGENASCVGCHESKNSTALPSAKLALAAAAGAQSLKPFYGPPRPFSFSAEIQPILNQHCIGCHTNRSVVPPPPSSRPGPTAIDTDHVAFSLLGAPQPDPKAGRVWSDAYMSLTDAGFITPRVNWIESQSVPTMLPPYSAGSATSKLISKLEKGHKKVKLNQEELDKLSCWIDLLVPFCGDYTEANLWDTSDAQKYDYFLQKRRRMQELEQSQTEALIESRYKKQSSVRLQLVDAAGNTVSENRSFVPGDRIRIAGTPYMMVRLGNLRECLVYSPEGRMEFPLPVGTADANAYSPDAFKGGIAACSARKATAAEIGAYRNLALNTCDIRGWSTAFPHATSNSEWHNHSEFAARNAIDGSAANLKHGFWPAQSWGPDMRTDLWWKVDFGRMVQVDKLVLFIRADFPHDQAWQQATLRFSDGTTHTISIKKTAEPQSFTFDKRTVSWVQLEGFEMTTQYCALTEVEIYGQDLGVGRK